MSAMRQGGLESAARMDAGDLARIKQPFQVSTEASPFGCPRKLDTRKSICLGCLSESTRIG